MLLTLVLSAPSPGRFPVLRRPRGRGLGAIFKVKSTMSPKVLQVGALVFWFHSYDARFEERASVHVGKGSQDDVNDAKVWLEPEIEIAYPGRTLRRHELNHALRVIRENHQYLLEEWYGYKGKRA